MAEATAEHGSTVALDRVSRRLTLLGAMAALLAVALAVPGAFSGSGATFGMAYLAVVLIHLTAFIHAAHISVALAMRGLAPFNVATALIVVAGGVAAGRSSTSCGARPSRSSGCRPS